MTKTIHYCWFGRGERTEIILKCIKSWKKYCPDYVIKEWNEDNFDVNCCEYVRQAYEAKKWAFVSDYCRFFVLYQQGGIYVDTDVEMLRPLDGLPSCFVGFESDSFVNSGLIRAAERGDVVCKKMLESYEKDLFILPNGDFNLFTVCERETEVLKSFGMIPNGMRQIVAGTEIFPIEYFNPKGGGYGRVVIMENTYTVHHYVASWKSPLDQKIMSYKVRYGVKMGKFIFVLRHPFLSIKKFFLRGE